MRIISIQDAITQAKGLIKILLSFITGAITGAIDLVETTDPNASPVRIMTPQGIKAWRKIF